MKIIFLGTGSSIPTPKIKGKPFRSYSAILLQIGGEYLLFDIGPGTLTKLQHLGIDTRMIPSNVFITHFHLDHCQDLPALIKSRMFNLQTGEMVNGLPINIFGPKGLKKLTKQLFINNSSWKYMERSLEFINFKEIADGKIVTNQNWEVSCISINHNGGVAYRIDSKGKSFVYTGDMTYDENIIKLAKNADLVVIECSFPNRKSLQQPHLCPEDVGKLARLGGFKRVILTHLYPQCDGSEDEMIAKVNLYTSSKVLVAYDFMKIVV